MGASSEHRQNGTSIRYDSQLLDPMEPRLFDPTWLQAEGYHHGTSKGRNQAHFLEFGGLELVLRHFQRGGMIGKVNRDSYLRGGRTKSRSFLEFNLLNWMHDQGLPVPRPVAALYAPKGVLYRAALLTQRIPEARPLEEVLRDRSLDQGVWMSVGAAVRRMHDLGVFHSDLNCRNILLDAQNRVWLIDFDKCRRRAPGDWTVQNLDRLLRSLRKENGKGDGLKWAEDDWAHLLAGYNDPRDQISHGGAAGHSV